MVKTTKEKPVRISKPQKSNRHKKIKAIDPFYVGKRPSDRTASISNKEPDNADEQGMPNSLKELLWLKKNSLKAKDKKKNNKKQKNGAFGRAQAPENQMERGMSRPLKAVPEFKKHKRENEKMFLQRVERETQAVINRSRFEAKFNVEVDVTKDGQTIITKNTSQKKKKKEKARLVEKKKKKKEKKDMKSDTKNFDFKDLQDQVEFGEVAMAPPSFSAKPRKAENVKSNKACKKSSLLLYQQLQDPTRIPVQRQVGQVQKKKHMSMAKQQIMETERNRAIELYRKMKATQQTLQKH